MKSRSNNTPKQYLQNPLWWAASLLVVLLTLTAGISEAAVHATLDRDTVSMGDTFTLTIESDSRQSDQQPDLSPLRKDFEVLGTGTSTQVSIFNGQRADKTLWQVQLQARHTGQLRIPAITVGGQQTAALELNVTRAPQEAKAAIRQHVFIEVETHSTGKQIYVQQQIPYTVRLYYDQHLQGGSLGAPEPKDAVVEQLGKEKHYSAFRNGHQYTVIERHYVISPEKSGSLQIPPTTFHGRITLPQQQGRSRGPESLMEHLFNNGPFANDPFFRNGMSQNGSFGGSLFGNPGKPITVRSRAINLQVKPRPLTVTSNWLPAETVTLADSWTKNPPQFKVGEPVSRTITIHTQGLAGSQIPELTIAAPAHTRLYPETPTHESRTDGKTIYGTRRQTLSYISSASGTLTVPAITLKWWDTRHNRAASTTLPAWQFRVQPGAAGTVPVPPPVSHSPAVQQSAPTKPAPVSKTPQANSDLNGAIPKLIRANWPWLLAGSGLLLALVLFLVFMARRAKQPTAAGPAKQTPKAAQRQNQVDQKSALQTLEKACAANDQHTAARAVLDLAHAHWPDDPPRNLDALAMRIEKGQAQLRELDRNLYAAGTRSWNGTALWTEFNHGLQEKKTAEHNRDDGLNPLYPQHT